MLTALRIDAERGLMRLAAEPYDEALVGWIRTLPDRRYRRDARDWSIPARREHLRAISGLIAELEERGIVVEVSETAGARLARLDVGRAGLRGDVIEIAGPYSERRLPALRALPERRFDPARKIWAIRLTRAGALAILALADDTDDLVVTNRARGALLRTAMANAPAQRLGRDSDSPRPHAPRRSPVPHWRHHTAGAIFDNPTRQRIIVPGIGLCVRIRVDPSRRRDAHPLPSGPSTGADPRGDSA